MVWIVAGEMPSLLTNFDFKLSVSECLIAVVTAPGGASAIWLTSLLVRMSDNLEGRDCSKIVVGP